MLCHLVFCSVKRQLGVIFTEQMDSFFCHKDPFSCMHLINTAPNNLNNKLLVNRIQLLEIFQMRGTPDVHVGP